MPINFYPQADRAQAFAKGQRQARAASMGQRAATPERLAAIKAANAIPGLRVNLAPGKEHLRGTLAHPNGMRFRPEGSIEWPNDRFTQRRIADGDIVIVEPDKEENAKPAPAQHGRRHASSEA